MLMGIAAQTQTAIFMREERGVRNESRPQSNPTLAERGFLRMSLWGMLAYRVRGRNLMQKEQGREGAKGGEAENGGAIIAI